MKPTTATLTPNAEAFARRVASRLTQAGDDLHHDIAERLRAARMQALAQRKRPATRPVLHLRPSEAVLPQGATAALGGGDHPSHWWHAAASIAWIAALLIGLAWVHQAQVENVTTELTEIDTALLTDDLPPSAYADPGFTQFIKSGHTKS